MRFKIQGIWTGDQLPGSISETILKIYFNKLIAERSGWNSADSSHNSSGSLCAILSPRKATESSQIYNLLESPFHASWILLKFCIHFCTFVFRSFAVLCGRCTVFLDRGLYCWICARRPFMYSDNDIEEVEEADAPRFSLPVHSSS